MSWPETFLISEILLQGVSKLCLFLGKNSIHKYSTAFDEII